MSNRESNIGGRRWTGPSVPRPLPHHIGTAVITPRWLYVLAAATLFALWGNDYLGGSQGFGPPPKRNMSFSSL